MEGAFQAKLGGIILAGGKSRRLGTDKAIVRLGTTRLVDIAVETLGSLVDSIVVVTNSPQLFEGLPARLTTDLHPGAGPLGGILSGLLQLEYEHSLVVACDMPFLNPNLIKYMMQRVANYDVVMPRLNGYVEPLHAIYSRRCIEPIQRLLAADDYRIIHFMHEVSVRHVESEEIDAFDPTHLSFFNINTPDDLARARAEYRRRLGES